jgi:hypothetical protein
MTRFIRTVTPFNFTPFEDPTGGVGNVVEELLIVGDIRQLLGGLPYLDTLHIAVGVNDAGEPTFPGFSINQNIDYKYIESLIKSIAGSSFPDFVFKEGDPVATDKNPPAYLIGDIKYNVNKTLKINDPQLRRILAYAKPKGVGSGAINKQAKEGGGHTYAPIAVYLSIKKVDPSHEARLIKWALNNFKTVLAIVDFGK